ncbi:flavodoxin domain-containing protein [Rothia sp. P6271]|uniref:flavodoxin domain-containing protein n=1 Tax=unclassified Rothia (in: high G+C Gram-positive bacteria) TaxID=2689056 RepID=UPI003AC597C5
MSTQNVVILFGSNYGFTERYCRWIAEELQTLDQSPNISLSPIAEATDELIESADVLIVGASYLGGFLTGAPTLRKRREAMLKVPHRVFFTVCFNGLAVYPREYLDKRVMKSYKEDVAGNCPTYHFRGGLDLSQMTKTHKTVLAGVRTAYRLKPHANEYDKQMIESFDNGGGDYTNREDIFPLVETVAGYLSPNVES